MSNISIIQSSIETQFSLDPLSNPVLQPFTKNIGPADASDKHIWLLPMTLPANFPLHFRHTNTGISIPYLAYDVSPPKTHRFGYTTHLDMTHPIYL